MRDLIKHQEIWSPIKGFEGFYEFSNLNNVKSLSRIIKRKNGVSFISKERILKPTLTKGYYKVCLHLNGKPYTLGIHQIIAIQYLEHIPCGFELVVDHINEIKTDNRLENLQIITNRENTAKSIKNCSSEYTGVVWSKKANKWQSFIVINKKLVYLGSFDTEKEASKCYKNALKNHLLGIEIKVKRVNFSSKYKGVYWLKSTGKWRSIIYIFGKSKHLGLFKTELEAHNAYQNALLKTKP